MSAQTTGLPIACWRIKGDAAAWLATGDWIDGTPDAETLKEYDRLGWSIEYAYCAEGVAELIEAASRAAIAACRGDDFHPSTIRNADLDALRAALANVGGAK